MFKATLFIIAKKNWKQAKSSTVQEKVYFKGIPGNGENQSTSATRFLMDESQNAEQKKVGKHL